jgi:hypothetical protein
MRATSSLPSAKVVAISRARVDQRIVDLACARFQRRVEPLGARI